MPESGGGGGSAPDGLLAWVAGWFGVFAVPLVGLGSVGEDYVVEVLRSEVIEYRVGSSEGREFFKVSLIGGGGARGKASTRDGAFHIPQVILDGLLDGGGVEAWGSDHIGRILREEGACSVSRCRRVQCPCGVAFE